MRQYAAPQGSRYTSRQRPCGRTRAGDASRDVGRHRPAARFAANTLPIVGKFLFVLYHVTQHARWKHRRCCDIDAFPVPQERAVPYDPSDPSGAALRSAAAPRDLSRRDFMAGVVATWVAASVACSRDAGKAAPSTSSAPIMHDAPAPARRLTHFTTEQGVEVEAIAARIIPSDDGPGAREANVLYFIDHTLDGYARDQAPLFADGLNAVSKAVHGTHGPTARFSTLTPIEQDAILKAMDTTPFFGAMRAATISGFLSLPSYGGNTDFVGWKYIGQDHVLEQTPPFGYYDLPANQHALLGRVL